MTIAETGICKYCKKKIYRSKGSYHWKRFGWPKQWKDECKGDNSHYPKGVKSCLD